MSSLKQRISWCLATLFGVGLLVGGLNCRPGGAEKPLPPFSRMEVEAWQQWRDAELRKPDGWLALVGLHWLEEGTHSFGSDPANAFVFPEKAPPEMGRITLVDSVISVEIPPGLDVRQAGRPVTSMVMQTDAAEAYTILEWQTLRWFAIERDGRYGIRVVDAESEALAAFDGIETYPIDARWALEARVEAYDPPRTIEIPTILGTVRRQEMPGTLIFEVDGETYRLDATTSSDADQYFIIFGDETNGAETYPAGRFVYVDLPDEQGRTVINFNKAYNPPCAFSLYSTCPLPPPQNKLPLRVDAGEKKYSEGPQDRHFFPETATR